MRSPAARGWGVRAREQKPSSRRLQQSHILQVGALCLLVQDVYGVRPLYGVVVLADGTQERVTFTEELERGVVRTMAEMRRMLETGAAPGPRWAPASWSGTNCRSGAECRDGTVRAYRFTNPSRRH